jgi:AcrR family transcriptional regulator
MDEPTSLRERKKQRTHEAISNAAIELFLRHGYDQVSIAQIADAAEVSRRTLFAYFPAKEDLVLHRISDHRAESARVVSAHPHAPLRALRAHFLDGLDRRDPITGLCDVPEILAYYRLLLDTPSLVTSMLGFQAASEEALVAELRGLPELTARLTATQITAVQWQLTMENHQRIASGISADDAYPGAVAAARLGFDLLTTGLGQLFDGD